MRGQKQRDHAGNLSGAELLGLDAQDFVGIGRNIDQVVLSGRRFGQQQVPEVGQRLGRDVAQVLSVLNQPADNLERSPDVSNGEHIGQLDLHLPPRSAQQRTDDGIIDLETTHHGGLVQQRKSVSRGALGTPRDGPSRVVVELNSLGDGHLHEVGRQVFHGQPAEVEPLTAADDGRRHLVRLGGRQDEPDTGRGLFEQLQQSVERFSREALGLVDDVDLLATGHRGCGGLLAQVPGVVHSAVGRRVDLDHVHMRTLADRDALLAGATRLRRGRLLAVDHLGQDARRGGLACSTWPTEEEGVMQSVLVDRPREGAHDMLLAQELGRRLRPIPPI